MTSFHVVPFVLIVMWALPPALVAWRLGSWLLADRRMARVFMRAGATREQARALVALVHEEQRS